MSQMNVWDANDEYIHTHLVGEPQAFAQATKDMRTTNMPHMEVSPAQGKFLYLLAKVQGAKRILEIGTFYGYSTMWFAKALPEDGLVVSMELTPKFVAAATENVKAANLEHKVRLVNEDAHIYMKQLIQEGCEPFDIIFIDAHKPSYPAYLELALALSKTGTIIIGDNIILDGELANEANPHPKATKVRAFVEALGENKRLESTALQTVGVKGYDGFTMSVVL